MTHSVTVASWNIHDQLSTASVRRKVLALDADIIVLPEAYAEDARGSQELKAAFHDIEATTDYEVHYVLYDDADDRTDRHGFVVLTKLQLEATVELLNIGRNVFVVRVDDLRVVCVHFDDREPATRDYQACELLQAAEFWEHVVIIGDFNVTHHSTLLGRFLSSRPVSWVIDRLPKGQPGTKQSAVARLGSLAERLRGMTTSYLMSDFALRPDGLFYDADVKERKTKLVSSRIHIAMAQLDHVLYRGAYVKKFQRHKVYGSDHLPIEALIEW